jgi:taurine dioxygenase
MDATPTPFDLEPLTPHIGALVTGADMRAPDAGLVRAVRAALLRWKVLFFCDNKLTTAQLVAFARQFGEPETNPVVPHTPGYPEVSEFAYGPQSRARENIWHSDVTWRAEPSWGCLLRAIEIPSLGGDTLFADMYTAYDGLSQAVKARIEGRRAMHDFGYLRVRMRKRGMDQVEIEAMERKFRPVEHPIVRLHPETGRKALYVNAAFTRAIVGMPAPESDTLLKQLCAQAAIPEYQCRFRWRNNAIAFWDNRASQHYAASDYWPAVRRMERVSLAGDRPY